MDLFLLYLIYISVIYIEVCRYEEQEVIVI